MVGSMLGTIESRYDMPGWDGLSVSDLLSEGLGVPAYLDNDVRAAATAAEWFGNGNTGGALYISVGNGMGFAYVQPQGIFRGAHGMAGQLEHLVIDRDGPVCECGNRGCLLTVATDSVFLKKLWPELPDDLRNVPMSRRSELMQDGYDLAAGGDVKAREALTSVLSALAVGLANVVNLFDPQVVYLFGALIDPAPDVILDIIRKEALPRVRPQVRGVEIRPIHGSWVDFFLRGSIGLVIGEQIRLLHQANASTRTINGLDGPTKTDRLTAKRMTQQPSNMLTGH
jgi:glucokinase